MSERSARRGLLRCTALVTAAVLAFGGTSTALAQDDPTSTSPTPSSTETVTPPPSSEQPAPPSSSTDPAPPSGTTPESPTPESPTQTPTQTPDPSTPVTPVAPPAATVEPAKPDEKKTEEKQAEQAAPDLKLSLSFDKPQFAVGEAIGLTVTVRNAGDAPANQIRFAAEPGGMYLSTGVDELISRPSLAPGESKTIKLGAIAESQNGDRLALTLRAYVEGATDKAPNDNVALAEAKIAKNSGRLSGVVYEDKNGNGVADPGENIAGNPQLKLTGGPDFPGSTLSVYEGRFSTWDIPAGTYQARLIGGWYPGGSQLSIKPGQFIVVKKDESTEIALQAGLALARSLEKAGSSFDKPKYAKGDAIAVSFTLKNNGIAPITGLVAVCDQENDPATLDGTGEGWGELRPDRGGVTIGAGETKTFTVTDTVPDVHYPTGKVYFACVFSVDGRNVDGRIGNPNSSDPGLTISADVAGTIGKVSGRVLHDGDGSPVRERVKVVAYNTANNRIVGDAQSDDWTGEWSIRDLAQGKIALKVVGRWKFADGSTQRLVDVVGDQDAKTDLAVVPGDEVKDPTVFAPDLKVSVTFDKQTYDINDPVLMTLKVENAGTGKAPARGDWRSPYTEEQPYFDYVQYSKFTESGIELWPGESKQITFVAKAPDGGSDPEKLRKLRYVAEIGSQSPDSDSTNNKAEARADVVWGTGTFSAVIYGDSNLNGKMDAGEALPNLTVQVGGGKPWVNLNAKSDQAGRVRFTGVPAGGYRTWNNFDRETGWIPAGSNSDQEQNAVVNPGDEGTAQIRMIRPLSDKLKASLKFDQPSYAAGAQVGVTASIKNETGGPIHVKADCSSPYGPYLGNDGTAWGLLARGAAGVEIADGATFTQHVDSPMPAGSPDYGYVGTFCTFGPENKLGNPWVSATAKVPGATQTFRGNIVTGDFMAPTKVPNVKVVLLDPDTNRPVASTTADAEGKWVFPDLPVGAYKPLVVGPWRVMDEVWQEGEGFGNVRGREYDSWIWVAPGPDVADPANAGSYKVTAVHDKNDNGWTDPDEVISGLKISLRDKATGGVVAERTTGADGKAEFTGVPAGSYWARLDGSWRFKGGPVLSEVNITQAGYERTFWLEPGVADALPRGVVRFEKSSYESHEKVRFWLTVTNIGGKTAEQVRLYWPVLAVELPQGVWGDFSEEGAGIQLAPGESRTFEGVGNIHDIRDGKLSIWGGLQYLGGPNPNSLYSGEVPVVQTKGDLSGVVYTDKNRNGQQDAGEATAGAVVNAYGGVPSGSLRTTTDADGRYSFKGIPSGDYSVNYTLADGWIVHRDSGTPYQVRVQPGAPVRLTARAERPFSESLSATLALDKNLYRIGEIATITITLTNSGDRAVSGIQPGCNRVGDANQLGSGEDWDAVFGEGVTVGAGETKTFIVKEKVPQASYGSGMVMVMCDFEPNPGYNTDGPFVHDSARVPGGFGSLVGKLYYDRNNNGKFDEGEAIGNTRIVLRDREQGIDVAEAVSDANGHVRFDHVPAGEFWAWVDGPWKFEGEYAGRVRVFTGSEWGNDFIVVPVTQPQPPAGGGGSTPPRAAAGGDALAKTGASVLGLGLVGALLVAFGFGASVFGRRRTA